MQNGALKLGSVQPKGRFRQFQRRRLVDGGVDPCVFDRNGVICWDNQGAEWIISLGASQAGVQVILGL